MFVGIITCDDSFVLVCGVVADASALVSFGTHCLFSPSSYSPSLSPFRYPLDDAHALLQQRWTFDSRLTVTSDLISDSSAIFFHFTPRQPRNHVATGRHKTLYPLPLNPHLFPFLPAVPIDTHHLHQHTSNVSMRLIAFALVCRHNECSGLICSSSPFRV
ncbi:unnamed protein product [Protopolystoma xenopodis]|uniref:Uncharacterized protein n=1 Tax=Protopolystoma xenopodis TaxID=117903 RepID=A0A3S5AZ89_9PLAT|nr:unnamed protein product [Protopolystoma xenopodis]